MLERITTKLRTAAGSVLGLYTAEDLRTAAQRVDTSYSAIVAEQDGKITQLKKLLESAKPKRVSPAVDAVVCPQCGAQQGELCKFASGQICRRTHKVRVQAWKELQTPEPATEPATETSAQTEGAQG